MCKACHKQHCAVMADALIYQAGKWFEPRSCLSGVIVRVRVVFRKIVVVTRQPKTRLIYIKCFWDYSTNLTTLRHPCSSQTYHYFTTYTDQHQGPRPKLRKTGSNEQNQVYWLPGHWRKTGRKLKTRLTKHTLNEPPTTLISGITFLNTTD